MLHATHEHLASKNENKRQKNIWTVVRSHERGHNGQGGLVLVCWAVCFNTQELVLWLYTHARMHTNCIHATLTQTHAPTHARNTHTYTRIHARTQHSHAHMHAHTSTPHDQHTLSRSSAQPTCACAHIRPWQTHTQPGESRARGGVLSRLRKFVLIWPFPYANWQVGPTRNMVNLTSQHGTTQTIWPVNRVQSDAELWASDRIITAKTYMVTVISLFWSSVTVLRFSLYRPSKTTSLHVLACYI